MRSTNGNRFLRQTKLLFLAALLLGLFLPSYVASSPGSQGHALSEAGATDLEQLPSSESSKPAIEGWITDTRGRPVNGAVVTVNGQAARSDGSGYFCFHVEQLTEVSARADVDYSEVSVAVSANGFAGWTISQARYYAADTLRLYPRLVSAGQPDVHVVAAPLRSSNSLGQA